MSTDKPKFVMVGVELPNGKVRIYASRDLPPHSSSWGTREQGRYGPTVWHLDTDMPYALIHDDTTWGRAFGRVFEIWENHDRNRAVEAAQAADRAALAGTRKLASGRLQRELEAEADLSPEVLARGGFYHFASGGAKHAGKESACDLCRPRERTGPVSVTVPVPWTRPVPLAATADPVLTAAQVQMTVYKADSGPDSEPDKAEPDNAKPLVKGTVVEDSPEDE